MSTRNITIFIVTVLIGIGGLFVFMSRGQNKDQVTGNQSSLTNSESNQLQTAESKPNQLTEYFIEEVKRHNSENDCWTRIGDSVYDITSYIPRHPGGDEILAACGADGTSLFEARTDSEGNEIGSGTPHSSSARKQLERLKIGIVVQ